MGLIGELAHGLGLGVVFRPERQVPLAEEILVVLEQLFQAGTGNAGGQGRKMFRPYGFGIAEGWLACSDAVRRFFYALTGTVQTGGR